MYGCAGCEQGICIKPFKDIQDLKTDYVPTHKDVEELEFR